LHPRKRIFQDRSWRNCLGIPGRLISTRFVIFRYYFRHLLFCSNTFLLMSQYTTQPWSTGSNLICGPFTAKYCKILIGNGCAVCACNGALYSYPQRNRDHVCTNSSLSTFMLALSSLFWTFLMESLSHGRILYSSFRYVQVLSQLLTSLCKWSWTLWSRRKVQNSRYKLREIQD
jgi:hypothetical protein